MQEGDTNAADVLKVIQGKIMLMFGPKCHCALFMFLFAKSLSIYLLI